MNAVEAQGTVTVLSHRFKRDTVILAKRKVKVKLELAIRNLATHTAETGHGPLGAYGVNAP